MGHRMLCDMWKVQGNTGFHTGKKAVISSFEQYPNTHSFTPRRPLTLQPPQHMGFHLSACETQPAASRFGKVGSKIILELQWRLVMGRSTHSVHLPYKYSGCSAVSSHLDTASMRRLYLTREKSQFSLARK